MKMILESKFESDKVVTVFWNVYSEIENEQKKLRNCMEVDKGTVGGHDLRQRLVSSGLFCAPEAQMMIKKVVSKGQLKEVVCDTYVRGLGGLKWIKAMLKEKLPPRPTMRPGFEKILALA